MILSIALCNHNMLGKAYADTYLSLERQTQMSYTGTYLIDGSVVFPYTGEVGTQLYERYMTMITSLLINFIGAFACLSVIIVAVRLLYLFCMSIIKYKTDLSTNNSAIVRRILSGPSYLWDDSGREYPPSQHANENSANSKSYLRDLGNGVRGSIDKEETV
jgi:hypothetical protein